MKQFKLFGAAIVALCLAACTQDEKSERVSEVVARIGWDICQSGRMTRAVAGDDVQQRISALLPTDAELNQAEIKIKRLADNVTLDARLGQTQTLKVGGYSCTFRWEPSGLTKAGGIIQREPSFDINASFEVMPDVTQYTLPAVFDCAALAWDNTLFELWKDGVSMDDLYTPEGDVSVIFIRDLEPMLPLRFILKPKDADNYTEMALALTTQIVEYGRYYLLRCPSSNAEGQTGVTFADFMAGTL